ncbi:MAG: DUF4388 domain-containing protein [Desulfobulbaceae bacterium]|nr:MAG: DUF4388 domain-containing protein [Desulfobulbaceae bacterium]
MTKQLDTFRDAIFLVTEENACPLYNVGDELKVENFGFSISSYKPGCLYLSQEIARIVASRDSFGGFAKLGSQKNRFDCGGCEGKIFFEFKKEKDFATLQMKLLKETEEKKRKQHLDRFFGVLRKLDIFKSLDDDSLSDLTLLLELKTIPIGKQVAKKGDPGHYLFIILSGGVEFKSEEGAKLSEMKAGEIFGEMSLLAGDPVAASVYTVANTQVAMLSIKNFKHVLQKYPVLQLFLLKLLVDRAQANALKSGNITSGMTGELDEIATVDLFQLINSSQKTGTVTFALDDGKAMVFFRDGEIIYARYLKERNKQAITALLGVSSGHFTYARGIPKELDNVPPIGGFMGLMMEGVQSIDEDSAQGV